MKFLKKHKKIGIAAAVIFLVLLFLPEKAENYDFGITYIGRDRMMSADFETFTNAVSDAVRSVPGYENAEIMTDEIAMFPDEGSGRQNAMARLLYGDGVIYIADYDLVRTIVDDDELFADIPDEIDADISDSTGRKIAISVNKLENIELSKEYDGLCVFIRSDIAEDKGLSDYLKACYQPACEALKKIN